MKRCKHCKADIQPCGEPRPCSGQCSSGNGWIHLHGTHGCMRRPRGWKGTGPYAEPEADDVESAVRAQTGEK